MHDALAAHYERIWEEAAPLVRAGAASLDPWLARASGEDARRGITLLAWPAAAVTARLGAFTEQLRGMEPGQRYQPESDMHHTVLSLFTATADHAPYMARLAEYREAVAHACAGTAPFAIDVRGVTLTPGAVLAQGFPRDDALAKLRDRLRAELATRGLGDALDQRYRLVTAHMTLVRFASPLRNAARFVDALATARHLDFGTTPVERLELVFGDWFHTAANEQVIDRIQLH